MYNYCMSGYEDMLVPGYILSYSSLAQSCLNSSYKQSKWETVYVIQAVPTWRSGSKLGK